MITGFDAQCSTNIGTDQQDGTSIGITDATLARALFRNDSVEVPQRCPAAAMGLAMFEAPQSAARIRHRRAIEQVLHSRALADELALLAAKVLEPEAALVAGNHVSLYQAAFRWVTRAFSEAQNYLGCSRYSLDEALFADGRQTWVEGFGHYVFNPQLNDAAAEAFLLGALDLGRSLVHRNVEGGGLGLLPRALYALQGLALPDCRSGLLAAEHDHPEATLTVYHELAYRSVRGLDNVAFTLSHCIVRICSDPAIADAFLRSRSG